MTTIAVACECPGTYGHLDDCPLKHYLIVKYRFCERVHAGHYLEPRLVAAIDRLARRRWRRLGIRGWL